MDGGIRPLSHTPAWRAQTQFAFTTDTAVVTLDSRKKKSRSYTCFEEPVLVTSLRVYVTRNAGGLARLLYLCFFRY
jgi:hypothetical protein